MIDIIGIVSVVIIGLILIGIGTSFPDHTGIILENTEKIAKLTTEYYQCENPECQKLKIDAMKPLEMAIDTYKITQNIRDNLIMWGIILETIAGIGAILSAISRKN